MDGKDVLILVQGVVQSTGSSLAWWVKNTLQADDFMEETTGVDLKHLGENELMFYPHLVGDKTIYQDPELRVILCRDWNRHNKKRNDDCSYGRNCICSEAASQCDGSV